MCCHIPSQLFVRPPEDAAVDVVGEQALVHARVLVELVEDLHVSSAQFHEGDVLLDPLLVL